MKKHKPIKAGFFVPPVFWLTLIITGLFNPGYDHRTDLVSKLGQIGTNTQYLFSVGLILCAILSTFFIAGIYKILRNIQESTLPVLMLVPFPVAILGAAIFPLPLSIHEIFGLPVVVLPLSPLLAIIMWPKDLLKNKLIGALALFLMMLGFTIYADNFFGEYIGIKQRVFHVGWSIWFIYLAASFTRIT